MVALNRLVLAVVFVPVALAGCGGKALRWEHRVHVVRAGDTLQGIAFRYRLDAADLAAWNGIENPDLIFAGQTLRLSAPPDFRATRRRPADATTGAATPQAAAVDDSPDWVWPANGLLLAEFGDDTSLGQGVDIGGNKGDFIFAAAGGQVVYSGSGLLGYGNLIILKHSDSYLSAYGHNDALLVREGEVVDAGQRIARMGIGPGGRAVLHFEIRIKGEPVDPMQFLPQR